jgi:UrcA family protein
MLVALSIGAVCTDASARPRPMKEDVQTFKVTLHFRISDLATESGLEKTYRRIRGAARRVCTAVGDLSDSSRVRHYYECYNEAVARAVSDINSQRLTAFHEKITDKRKSAS